MIRTVENLRGPAGRLEAVLNEGVDTAVYTALLSHPHPPSGGTMHTRAVYQAMKVFESFGVPTLRFNFRGVGMSEGVYDDGRGEVEDVRAALDWLQREFGLPVLLGGFSFGANVSWRAGCGDARVAGLVGLGMPIQAGGRWYSYEFIGECTQPKLIVVGADDPFAPRAATEAVFAQACEPKKLVWIAGAEHFFLGVPDSPAPKLGQMQAHLRSWLMEHFLQAPQEASR